jgi:hypothetical protein
VISKLSYRPRISAASASQSTAVSRYQGSTLPNILVPVTFDGLDDAVAVPQAIFRPPGREVQICFGVSARWSGAMSARLAAEVQQP